MPANWDLTVASLALLAAVGCGGPSPLPIEIDGGTVQDSSSEVDAGRGAVDAGGTEPQCTQSSDCASGSYCNGASECVPQISPGSVCTADDQCQDNLCGVSGSGNCCASPCPRPACVDHVLTLAAVGCDTAGACVLPTPASVDCAPYLCANATACASGCASDSDCIAPGICDSALSTCCAGYEGGILRIDGTRGQDQACCGSGPGGQACATIAYAIRLAGEHPGITLILDVANPPNGADWTADSFPIELGYGDLLHRHTGHHAQLSSHPVATR
jgi:hypothetical protein